MVNEGIILGHKISRKCSEVDNAKIELITKLSPLTTVKGIQSFLEYARFYRRFIKDLFKISSPICKLLEKDAKFVFDYACLKAFELIERKICVDSYYCNVGFVTPTWTHVENKW